MTEETKKLFNAPWEVQYCGESEDMWITNNKGDTVADIPEESREGERIGHLPELYDALVEACCEYCPNLKYDLNHCDNCCGEDCKVEKWVELLRTVREGK